MCNNVFLAVATKKGDAPKSAKSGKGGHGAPS